MTSSMIPTCLKRQPRTKTRRPTTRGQPLHIIPELSEEDEPCSSSSSHSPAPSSPLPSVKARRRFGNLKLSEIRVAKDILIYQDDHLIDQYDLCSPRPAPSPPTSPSDLLYAASVSPIDTSPPTSPHVPSSLSYYQLRRAEMASPPSQIHSSTMASVGMDDSSSSSSVSPTSCSTSLPPTPTSDDEFFPSADNSVRPLTITKMRPSIHSNNDDPYGFDISVYGSPELRQPFKNQQEMHLPSDYEHISPVMPDSDTSDSEEASDWYTREFSEILTLCSPMPKPTPLSRPEEPPVSPMLPPRGRGRRVSKPLPALPRPSAQLDPAYPVRRCSIPARPPPPPPMARHSRTHRPPPRMSVPVDMDFSLLEDDTEYFASSATTAAAPSPSISSFSYSEPHSSPVSPSSSSGSIYSQESGGCDVEFDVDIQFELEMDQPMRLPLSLPSTPIDLESDITHAFDELRSRLDVPLPQQANELLACNEEVRGTGGRVLRSRWSSSTLSSTFSSQQEQHMSMLSPSKLRFYFGGSSKSKKSTPSSRGRKSSVSSNLPPPTPVTPMTPRTPSRSRGHIRGVSTESGSAVLPLGHYGRHGSGNPAGGGVRRRGSTSSCSVAGSDSGCSECSSGSSSGLRRKPIPVEMFLRST